MESFTIKDFFNTNCKENSGIFFTSTDFPSKKQEKFRNFNIDEILCNESFSKDDKLDLKDNIKVSIEDSKKINITKCTFETLKNDLREKIITNLNFFQKLSLLLANEIVVIDVDDNLNDILRINYEIKDYKNSILTSPTYILNVKKNVSLKLSEMFFDNNSNVGSLILPLTFLFLEDSSNLDCCRYIETKNSRIILSSTVNLKANSNYNLINLNFANELIRQDVEINLQDEKSFADVSSLNFSINKSLIDNFINVNHNANFTDSSENFKYILKDFSKTYFTGEIFVKEGFQKINASQNCKSILLSKNARAFARPWLKIFADDVKCSHGATFGELDKDALFYLETRGINEDMARKMLINAFLSEVLFKVQDEDFSSLCYKKFSNF